MWCANFIFIASALDPRLALAQPLQNAYGPKTSLAAQQVEPTEPTEPVEQVEPRVVQNPSRAQGLLALLARFHPALVHLPMGGMILFWLLEIGALGCRHPTLKPASLYVGSITLLSFIPAILSGLSSMERFSEDPHNLPTVLMHRNMMLAGVGLGCLALGLRIIWDKHFKIWMTWVYLALLTAVCVGITLGGHVGGTLVYGETMLPF